MKARIILGVASALIALTVSFMAFAGTPGAVATQDQPVIAGQDNTETNSTSLCRLSSGICGFVNAALLAQFDGTNGKGLEARANGSGGTGVLSTGGSGGTGVLGSHLGSSGIGVHGRTGGVGSGVYGEATANGVGVFGDTVNGTGVIARSTTGNALDVRGKATFSRSGVVIVAEGTSSKTVTLTGVTTSSMVLATAQQAKATHVKAAVPGTGSFIIRLTGKAPVGGLKVAYFVMN
jgi:hypothetical protein